jgi:hypothetical protein
MSSSAEEFTVEVSEMSDMDLIKALRKVQRMPTAHPHKALKKRIVNKEINRRSCTATRPSSPSYCVLA